jgi:hypothetical protein
MGQQRYAAVPACEGVTERGDEQAATGPRPAIEDGVVVHEAAVEAGQGAGNDRGQRLVQVQRGRDPARRGCVDADHTDHVEATPLVADELASNPTRQESVPNHRVAAETRTNQSDDWAEPRASVQEQEPSLQYARPRPAVRDRASGRCRCRPVRRVDDLVNRARPEGAAEVPSVLKYPKSWVTSGTAVTSPAGVMSHIVTAPVSSWHRRPLARSSGCA